MSDSSSGRVVEWVRRLFADRLADIEHSVQDDLEGLLQNGGSVSQLPSALLPTERASWDPLQGEYGSASGVSILSAENGSQRAVVCRILEHAITALAKLFRQDLPSLSPEEVSALEFVVLLYGRPAIVLNRQGEMERVPAFWNIVRDQHEEIEVIQQGVGRIEVEGHRDVRWVGTCFLISETCAVTNFQFLHVIGDCVAAGAWRIKEGMQVRVNFAPYPDEQPDASVEVRSVLGGDEEYGFAVLVLESTAGVTVSPFDLDLMSLAYEPPASLKNRPVYLIGYPAHDSRRDEPELAAHVCHDLYNIKSIRPGLLQGYTEGNGPFIEHDCAMLGNSAGSCLVDLETHQVLGIHLSNRFAGTGRAVPVWLLRDDPLLRRAGAMFADSSSSEEVMVAKYQIERLSRSHLWQSARTVIEDLFNQAFGSVNNGD